MAPGVLSKNRVSATMVAETLSRDQLRTSSGRQYKLLVSKTVGRMIVDHADGLHEGVADGRPDKIEAAFFQVFAHFF